MGHAHRAHYYYYSSHPAEKATRLRKCETFCRPATPLRQPMKTTLSIALLFLLVFFVMVLVAMNCEPRIPAPQVLGSALDWTLHLLGGVVAAASAIGMLVVAAAHGSFQRQIVLALPLLGGLLLIAANWGVALAFGAIVAVWIFRFGAPEIERGANATAKIANPNP